MEIFINGQAGLASSDENVKIGELINYMAEELGKQRMIAQAYTLDGKELNIQETPGVLERQANEFSKLEIDVAPFEVVAQNVVGELIQGTIILGEETVKITELFQKGQLQDASKRLDIFADSVVYVIEALKPIIGLSDFASDTKLKEGKRFDETLTILLDRITGLKTSLEDKDYATVGDVLEFDIKPSLESLTDAMGMMRVKLDGMIQALKEERKKA